MVPEHASRFFSLAAKPANLIAVAAVALWLACIPSAHALRPSVAIQPLVPSSEIQTSPEKTHAGGCVVVLVGRHLLDGSWTVEIATGCEACGYKLASGLASWLNADPLREGGGINLYAFAGNNGINAFDPWGLILQVTTDAEVSLKYNLAFWFRPDLNVEMFSGEPGWGALGLTEAHVGLVYNIPDEYIDLTWSSSRLDRELKDAAWKVYQSHGIINTFDSFFGDVMLVGGLAKLAAAAVDATFARVATQITTSPSKLASQASRLTEASGLTPVASGGPLQRAAFAQRTFNETFSSSGTFATQTVDDVATALRSGSLTPQAVPIQYIIRDGNTLILNTRSAQALTRAGIPRVQWNAVNMTGNAAAEARLTAQLLRNGLTSEGTFIVTPGVP